MASRTLSWQQMVLEADPDWLAELNQPDQYEFGNVIFYHNLPLYDAWEFRLDDTGQGNLNENQLGSP